LERNASIVAWATWGLSVALAGISVFFLLASWSTQPPPGSFGFRGFAAIFAVVFGTVGALVVSRIPTNPIGWLLLGGGLLSGIQSLANEYAIWAVLLRDPPAPLGVAAAWVPAWIWLPGTASAMLTLFLFPDGRLLSQRWRWAVIVGLVGTLASTLAFALAPGPLENFRLVDNPIGIEGWPALIDLGVGALTLYGLGFIIAGTSAVIRFRRATGEERQQMRWLVAAGLFCATTLVVSFVDQITNVDPGADGHPAVALLVIAGFVSLPLAMGVAILRYRLYDLDLVIRKTVVFGILVVLLTAVFLVVAAAVGGTIAGNERHDISALALAFAIGVMAIPLWRVSRKIADRIVFGGRATPYEVLAEFAGRLSETYAAEDVLPRMANVLGAALGAEQASVWLQTEDGLVLAAYWPSGQPLPVSLPPDPFDVRHQGELLGVLAVRQPASDPMTTAKERLARDLAAQSGPVLRNVRLLDELKRSRRRIVAAQDERAKKLERDIHDGAQQQIVALAVKQRIVASLVGRDDERARDLLAELQTETNDALSNLRDLARGIYPPLLADEGLVAAIEAQARKSPVSVRVSSGDVGRYPPEVESAVYFAVLEALQNVAKYAEASTVDVQLSSGDGVLEVSVTDDGVGFEVGAARGSGLQGMADRIAAIGGDLDVQSAPGSGTTLRARVPV
jgi:signal transduction histidine kinase